MSNEIKGILSPLLEELKKLNETLSFQEFFNAMELLMKSLTPTEKNILLMTGKSKQQPVVEYNFKPKINQIQKTQPRNDMYERGLQKKREIWRRIMHEKEEKEKAEMKECIFKPNIAIKHKKTQSSAS